MSDIEREDLHANIQDCRARVLRGVIRNFDVKDIVTEVEECTKHALGLPNAATMYTPLTDADANEFTVACAHNPAHRQVAASFWMIAASKINTLYAANGYAFRLEEFFIAY